MDDSADIIIVGAGAAGLMAALWAARSRPDRRVVVLDGARTIGAKILVSGGGRCNVTHHEVTADAFAGSSRNAIRKVLKRFDVPETVALFSELGVELKREDTGKLFPVSDSARTVLNALLRAVRELGVQLNHPYRVTSISQREGVFAVSGDWGSIDAHCVVLATGGMSLPKSGSDGKGFEFARSFGHTITPRTFPALVPMIVADDHFTRSLSGLSTDVIVRVETSTGAKAAEFSGSLLCTHFGLSGPVVLDISRYYIDLRGRDPGARFVINWLPGETFPSVDRTLIEAPPNKQLISWLRERLPDRLARALAAEAGVDIHTRLADLSRDDRRRLVHVLVDHDVPITGDRGFNHAEVTAGGVPLSEIDLKTMESRRTPGLYIIGEVCDVDGRIGGYNFQWAWASGYIAGISV